VRAPPLPSEISLVIPSSSNRKCDVGSTNGEFRIGLSITTVGKQVPLRVVAASGASCRIVGGRVTLDGIGAALWEHRISGE